MKKVASRVAYLVCALLALQVCSGDKPVQFKNRDLVGNWLGYSVNGSVLDIDIFKERWAVLGPWRVNSVNGSVLDIDIFG